MAGLSDTVLVPWADIKAFADAGYTLYYVAELFRYRPFVVSNNNVLFTNLIFPAKFTERGVSVGDQAAFQADHDDFVNNYLGGAVQQPQLFNPEVLRISIEGREYTTDVAAVAKGANATIVTFTPGQQSKTFAVTVASTGYAKWEVYYGTTGSETLQKTLQSSPSEPTIEVAFNKQMVDGETVYVQGYNQNTAAGNMDMSATVEHEVG